MKLISYILRYILVILFFVAMFKGELLWMFFLILMVLASYIPVFIRRVFDLSYTFDSIICLALIFHVGNGFLGLSETIPLYNKFTHFFSAFVVAFIVLSVLYYIDNENYKLLFDIVVITMAFGVCWEFMEWSTDFFFGLHSQLGLNDTMGDLLSDTVGALCVVFLFRKDFYGLLHLDKCLGFWAKS